MELYRTEDINAITNELDNIVDKATYKKITTQEPTIFTCNKIKDDILKVIKEKKRIIYGGTAYNELIKYKNKKDGIYSDKECKDIEFYSPVPFEDIAEICELLNKKYEYVSGSEAAHSETFTIFVNFSAFCDITYMPGPIYYKMPKKLINGLNYSHPSFILVDILRQYNDPLNSYWRLKDKTYFRANKLLSYYPLELDKGTYNITTKYEDIISKLFYDIKPIVSLIHLGTVANNYYLNTDLEKLIFNDYLVVMTDKLEHDTKLIYELLLKIVSVDNAPKVTIENYHPFFQFWDKRNIILYDNQPIIILLGHNKICLPYHVMSLNNDKPSVKYGEFLNDNNDNNNSIKLATFILLFNYHLIQMHYYYIYENKHLYKQTQQLMSSLLKERVTYLKKHKATVIDKTPYQEFIIECYGKGIDTLYESKLRIIKKKKKGLPYKYSYDPKSKHKHPTYLFQNSSGKIINKIKIDNIDANNNDDNIDSSIQASSDQ